jgi:hypothetical protein
MATVGHKIGQNSNRENQKKDGLLPKGIITPSFIEIALAVTKLALLTDDDDPTSLLLAPFRIQDLC